MTKQDKPQDYRADARFAALIGELLTGRPMVDWEHQDPDIAYDGKRIVLPDQPGKMSLREAGDLLYRKADDEEQEMTVKEVIKAFPLDGAVAFVKAMKELYGWASPIPTMTFFGPMPPQLITVQTGPWDEAPTNQVQVPWGKFTVPGIEEAITIGRENTLEGPVFVAYGTVKKREQHILVELANRAREILKVASIYKGKAIRLKVSDDGALDIENAPEFISTKYTKPDELIVNADIRDQLDASLWAPIQNTEIARQHSIPLKRGVLLEGPYGGGKTMIANTTAKISTDNGWTYILLDDIRALKDALLFAQRYQPAVVFAEDADRIADKRDQRGNDLLNTIDGILSKNSEVITVLTTNYVEKLERAMLRPGRLDAVITVSPPDASSVIKLVRLYARGLINENDTLDDVGTLLAGNIPATIREVVERAKLTMIFQKRERLLANDLVTSAKSMTRHLELLNFQPVKISDGDQLVNLMQRIMVKSTADTSAAKAIAGQVNDVLVNVVRTTDKNTSTVSELTKAIINSNDAAGKNLKAIAEKVNTVDKGVAAIKNYHDIG